MKNNEDLLVDYIVYALENFTAKYGNGTKLQEMSDEDIDRVMNSKAFKIYLFGEYLNNTSALDLLGGDLHD